MAEANEKTNDFSKGRLTQQVDDHERRLTEQKDEQKGVNADMWEAINAIRNRPPVWCTVVIGILLAALGYLARAAMAAIGS